METTSRIAQDTPLAMLGSAGRKAESRVNPKPTKREWVKAYLDGLERSEFTGFVDLRLTFNGGGISRVIPMRQDLDATLGS